MNDRMTLALPSKGAIADPTLSFLRDCGLRVDKPNPRQYTGTINAMPQVDVLFQRVRDVVYKVSDGTAQLGITGYDVVCEQPHPDLIVIHPGLGYGHCKLLVAVSETWVDVENMADLVDVALDFREGRQRNLRVATTYTHLARQYLHTQGIHHFTLVKAEGAIEAAPTLGYADIIIDLTQTGTTLRENHLKPLPDGIIVDSQACLIGNRRALQQSPWMLDILRTLLEYVDAATQGRNYYQITANIKGESAEEVAERVSNNPITQGLQGPTISPILGHLTENGRWYTASIVIRNDNLLAAVEYLRSVGGTQTTAVPVRYVFMEQSSTFLKLMAILQG